MKREIARPVDMTPPFVHGLCLMAKRVLRVELDEATRLIGLLTPKRAPCFGDMWSLTAEDIRQIALTIGLAPSPVDTRTFASLCGRIDPWTTLCDGCGELMLSEAGGHAYEATAAGTRCPFCHAGTAVLSRVVLRTVNWATGALVEPNMPCDVRSEPGKSIPLTDDRIRVWAASGVDGGLQNLLNEHGIPLHGFLAYCNLRLHTPDTFGPRKAEELLANPWGSGLDTTGLERMFRAAARYLDARQVTNVPRRYLTDGRSRPDFVGVTINNRPYLIEGRLGQGDTSDVYLARTEGNTPMFVVVKALVTRDWDAMTTELVNLRALAQTKIPGAEYLKMCVPELLATGTMRCNGNEWPTTVMRYQHGMDWSLEDVMRAYPDGVSARAVAWMGNRLFQLLDLVHSAGLVHNAVLPPHLIIHTLDHAVALVGWSMATRPGQRMVTFSQRYRDCYPEYAIAGQLTQEETAAETFWGDPVSFLTDVTMAARTLILVAGGNPAQATLPQGFPSPMADVLVRYATAIPRPRKLYELAAKETYDALKKAARESFGPPRYEPFDMPLRAADERK